MAQQIVNIGTVANDGTGDPIRDAFDKCNDNFTELYATTAVSLEDYGVSTSASATVNTAAIETVMAAVEAAGGGRVQLMTPGTYSVEKGATSAHTDHYACILVPSNTTLEFGPGVIIQAPADTSAYVIRNRNPVNGDSNIRISGGEFDGNWSTLSGDIALSSDQGFFGMIAVFENITDFVLENAEFRNPGKWAVWGTKLTRARFSDIHMDSVRRDGIHLCGSCYDVTIERFSGTTSDNAVAISTAQNISQGQVGGYYGGQFNWSDGTLVAGDMKRITVRDCQFANCDGPVAIFGRSSESIHQILIDNVMGTVNTTSAAYIVGLVQYALIGSDPDIQQVTIRNINCTGRDGTAAVAVSGDNIKDITLQNIIVNQGKGVYINEATIDNMRIDNLVATEPENGSDMDEILHTYNATVNALSIGNISYQPGSNGGRMAINFDDNTVANISIDQLHASGSYSAGNYVILSDTTNSIDTLTVDVGYMRAGGGSLSGLVAGPVKMNIKNLRVTGSQQYIAAGGAYLNIDSQTTEGTSIWRIPDNSIVTVREGYINRVYTYSDFASASANVDLAFDDALPRGAVLTGWVVKHTTAFAGGSISAATVALYDGGNLTTPYDVFAATGNTAPTVENVTPYANNINATPAWKVRLAITGGVGNDLTAGVVSIRIKYYATPSKH